MELAFKTQALRERCENADLATTEFGSEVAAELTHRLADLRAAVSLKDMVAGSPTVNDEGLHIKIGDTHILDLVANHVKNPLTKDGGVDWDKVSRVRVLGLRRRADF